MSGLSPIYHFKFTLEYSRTLISSPLAGQLVAFVTPNIGAANGLAVLVAVIQTLTMGYLIAPQSLPSWYLWAYWVNPYRY